LVPGPGGHTGRVPLTWLDPIDPIDPPPDVLAAGRAHPMRTVTHAAAAEVGAWSGDTPALVRATFDGLAAGWDSHHTPDRLDPVDDALERGGHLLPDHGTWLELGSGDGWATAALAAAAPTLIALDLSLEMLRRAPGAAPRVQADAARLPLPEHAATVAVLMNMLLFPTELDRVLAPGGAVVWISSRGPATPIHLTPEQVVAALPGRWGGVAAQRGVGVWAVVRREG
jgi:SAM-dependent methyltransferase